MQSDLEVGGFPFACFMFIFRVCSPQRHVRPSHASLVQVQFVDSAVLTDFVKPVHARRNISLEPFDELQELSDEDEKVNSSTWGARMALRGNEKGKKKAKKKKRGNMPDD